MADAPKPRSGQVLAASVAGVALAQTLLSLTSVQRWLERFHDRWVSIPSIESATRMRYFVDRAYHAALGTAQITLGTALLASFVLVILGFVVRILARASVRAGHPDPLDQVREWTRMHPRWLRALSLVVFGGWAAYFTGGGDEGRPALDLAVAQLDAHLLAVGGGLFLYWLARKGGAALLAPTLEQAAPRPPRGEKSEIIFDAVAVTLETNAALLVMMMATAAMLDWLIGLSMRELYHDRSVYCVLAAFAATALGGALLFRRASKVAVGIDGVRVQGTSRTTFYAYRDLDAARLNGTDIELVRGDRAVLRLQLHGEDAAQRGLVLNRIRKAIDRVKEGRGAAAAQIVSSAKVDDLARAASGAGAYRAAALTREQLWALVEGPEVDATARRTAAEALARTGNDADGARLRVAAELCAAPEVRVALEQLAPECERERDGVATRSLSQTRA